MFPDPAVTNYWGGVQIRKGGGGGPTKNPKINNPILITQ